MTTPASEAAERQSKREQAERDWISWLVLRELFGQPALSDYERFEVESRREAQIYERLRKADMLVRDCECMTCGHLFITKVKYGPTPKLSGELSVRCPRCNSDAVVKVPQRIVTE